MLEHIRELLRSRFDGLPRIAATRVAPVAELRRSAMRATWEARLAVRAGVRLEDFLRQRLAGYATQLRIPASDLPVAVQVEAGEPVVRPRPKPRSYDMPGREDARWLRALVEREGPVAAREIRDAEAEVDALDGRIADQRRIADAVGDRLVEDAEAGVITTPPRVEATPEQEGRPRVPRLAPIAALQALAATLLAAETWQIARPVLAISGIEIDALVAEAAHRPLEAGLALAFALGAAASIFVLADLAVRRAGDLVADAEPPRRRRLVAALSVIAAAAALALAALAAGLAPDPAPRAGLLAAIPFATAVILRAAAALRRPREAALEAALAWDRARVREAAERARRADALALARANLRALEDERVRAARRLRALQARAVAAHEVATKAAAARAADLERLADALASAIELDRYAFVRFASAASQDALVRPARQERFEPATSERFVTS